MTKFWETTLSLNRISENWLEKKRQYKDYEMRTSTLESYQHTRPGSTNAIAILPAVFYPTASKSFLNTANTYVHEYSYCLTKTIQMDGVTQASKCRMKARCVWFLLPKAFELKCSSYDYLQACFTNTGLVLTLNEVFFPRLCRYTWLQHKRNIDIFYNSLQGFQYGPIPTKLNSHQDIWTLSRAVAIR